MTIGQLSLDLTLTNVYSVITNTSFKMSLLWDVLVSESRGWELMLRNVVGFFWLTGFLFCFGRFFGKQNESYKIAVWQCSSDSKSVLDVLFLTLKGDLCLRSDLQGDLYGVHLLHGICAAVWSGIACVSCYLLCLVGYAGSRRQKQMQLQSHSWQCTPGSLLKRLKLLEQQSAVSLTDAGLKDVK